MQFFNRAKQGSPDGELIRKIKYVIFAGLAATCTMTMPIAPGVALGQTAATADSLDIKAKADVVEATAKVLTDRYVFPDRATTAAALIRDNLQKGRYTALSQVDFAKALTDDLRTVTHDKHVNVTVDGTAPSDGDSGAPPPDTMFGFERADRLKGNIGYVKLDGFHPPEALSVVADELMPKLVETDALIIDMRDNHGGDPAGVSRLVSFFVAAGNPIHVNDLIWRKAGTDEYTREPFFTSATSVSYRNKPIYLLTSSETFSGGEEFSYDMQVMKLATLIGETTGGGANPGDVFPLGSGLSIFVSGGRAENPITKTSWEGVGVKPDIATPANQAFATAYAAALKVTRQPLVTTNTPDDVSIGRLLVLRTEPYPQGESYIRREVEALVRGDHAFELFSPAVADALHGPVSPELKAIMQGLGPIQKVQFLRIDPLGSDEYEVTYAKGAQVWALGLNAAGKIIIFNFRPK